MSKFDLNDERDHLAIQTRLDWICHSARMVDPIWVWDSVVQVFEEDCGLQKGFIKSFQKDHEVSLFYLWCQNQRDHKLAIHDLSYRLSIEEYD